MAPELPARIEQVVWCAFEAAQAAHYRSFQEASERELFDLEASGAGEGRMRLAVLTQLLRLRQICCDPRLAGAKAPEPPAAGAGPYPGSAKLEAFREILEEATDGGHRLLVFSQFTSLLALVQEDLAQQGIEHCRLDGSMTAAARQVEIDRFQAPGGPPVFLLSLKAGGRASTSRRPTRSSTSTPGGIPPPRRRRRTAPTGSARPGWSPATS